MVTNGAVISYKGSNELVVRSSEGGCGCQLCLGMLNIGYHTIIQQHAQPILED